MSTFITLPRGRDQRTEASKRVFDSFEGAVQKWPNWKLSLEKFERYLAVLGVSVTAISMQSLESLYLCAACVSGIEPAYNTVEKSYFGNLRRCVAKYSSHQDFIDEVIQRARQRLFLGCPPKIATYRGEGPFTAWLRTLTVRICLDELRKMRTRRRLESSFLHASQVVPPNFDEPYDRLAIERLKPLLSQSFLLAIEQLPRGALELVRAFYFDRCGVECICRRLDVDRATVYRRLRRTEALVLSAFLGELRNAGVDWSAAEAGSILMCYSEVLDPSEALTAAVLAQKHPPRASA